MTGILVEQGDLGWDSQVRNILPGYQRDENDSARNATISDILSHRTGVLGPDGYWMLSEGRVAFSREDFAAVFSSLPTVQPIRTAFIYNNFAYELLGQVIEKISGTTLGTFLRESIMKPLGMTRTFDTRIPPDVGNVAKPYGILRNRVEHELPMPLVRQDGLFSAAGGIRTSVSDLLAFYNALIDAGLSELGQGDARIPGNPLKQLRAIWEGMISLPFPALQERSYALGWARTQLPSAFGLDGPKPWKAVVGKQSPSRLAIYHQGIVQGFTSFTALVPETRSAVVVLSNAGGLNEAGMLIASAIVDTLLGADIDHDVYTRLAYAGYEEAASRLSRTMERLEGSREVDAPIRPLESYIGRYYNSLGNFFIDIRRGGSGSDSLSISFMGNVADTFGLVPYKADKFFWHLTHDECVSRGRLPDFPDDYYIVSFVFQEDDAMQKVPVLYWKPDSDYPGEGDMFKIASGSPNGLWSQLFPGEI